MIPKYQILEKPRLNFQGGRNFEYEKEFAMFQFSGSGQVSANMQLSKNFGCEEKDFEGFTSGRVALIRRGQCFFTVKVENAIKAKASGVIIINSDGKFIFIKIHRHFNHSSSRKKHSISRYFKN
jgi:hypothetical protein